MGAQVYSIDITRVKKETECHRTDIILKTLAVNTGSKCMATKHMLGYIQTRTKGSTLIVEANSQFLSPKSRAAGIFIGRHN